MLRSPRPRSVCLHERNPSVRIDFVVRSDSASKFGGDSRQVSEYARGLRERGYEIAERPYVAGMAFAPNTIVHVVNVDRPYDFLQVARAAGRNKLVVSAIHHDLQAVRAMRKAEKGEGIRSVIGRALPESGRELVAFAVRSLGGQNGASNFTRLKAILRATLDAPFVWARVGEALNRAQSVTLLALGEEQSLRRDTGWRASNEQLVPNGISTLEASLGSDVESTWRSRPLPIIVAGRIEPRKRQVEVAREAIRLGVAVTFVGPISQSASRYSEVFRDLVAAHPEVTWAGGMAHEDVLAAFRGSRVLLNASWVEVQSLVDLEASFAGCYVVAASTGNSKEWLPMHVTVRGFRDIAGMLLTAKQLSERDSGPGTPNYSWTWDDCALALDQIYAESL